jgi:ribosomal protein L11 methyltransferase
MSEVPRYPYVLVDLAEDEADEASALLFDLGAAGVEQRDGTTLARGAPGAVTLVASFEHEQGARTACAELSPRWSPRVEEVVGDAWRDEWKKYFEPFVVCPGVVVRPPWREHSPEPGQRVVVLEPGRAFGTGLHETTSLVAEVLAGSPLAGATVLDVGCGSGILALVALALGAGSARAIDVDPEAIAVARENAARNAMSNRLRADETPVEQVAGTFDVVLANIEARTLVELAPTILSRVAPGGLLVLSGILAPAVAPTQLPDIERAYAAVKGPAVTSKGEWIAYVARR